MCPTPLNNLLLYPSVGCGNPFPTAFHHIPRGTLYNIIKTIFHPRKSKLCKMVLHREGAKPSHQLHISDGSDPTGCKASSSSDKVWNVSRSSGWRVEVINSRIIDFVSYGASEASTIPARRKQQYASSNSFLNSRAIKGSIGTELVGIPSDAKL